jgi:hypothetical protein
VKGWRKIYQVKGPQKQTEVAILTSGKVYFELTFVKRDKEGHFMLIKGAINQEEITIINLYAPNASAPNIIKHTLKELKSHIDPNTVVLGNVTTPLSPIDR